MPVDGGAAALAAAMMMALSPVTGPCEGRALLLCDGSGVSHRVLVWDEEAPMPGPQNAGKACHACTFDKRKPKPDNSEGARV